MFLPVDCCLLHGDLFQLKGQLISGSNAIFPIQHETNGIFVLFVQFPYEGAARGTARTGIRDIEHITERGGFTAGIEKRYAFGAATDIAVHGGVPHIILGACRCLRALGVDQELIGVRIFIQPRSRLQIVRPFFMIGGNLPRSILCKLYIGLQFIRHVHPPRQK